MKKLKLHNKTFNILLESFTDWLEVLGYAETTRYYLPNHLKEFFHWLEQNNINTLEHVQPQTIKDYYQDLQLRPNRTRSGSLSKSYLNKHQQALKKFREYLQKHNYSDFRVHLKTEKNPVQEKLEILTQEEIKMLFRAAEHSHQNDKIKLRDKAMLAILYSCGLRRNEAVHLDVNDILFDKERIYVRKGKNYKERFVPINSYNLRLLEDYIYEGRPLFYQYYLTEALFINKNGKRLQGQTLLNRLQHLIKITGYKELQNKHITLHTLRHSIATHLLEKEVDIEIISKFLGHSSLESTQIYTHLIKIP